MRFQCPYEKRLDVFYEQLVDRNILLNRSNAIRESLVPLQGGLSLRSLHPLQEVRQGSTCFRQAVCCGESSHGRVKLFFQPAQALKDRHSALIDCDELVERHLLDGLALLEHVLRKKLTLCGFTIEKLDYLFERA